MNFVFVQKKFPLGKLAIVLASGGSGGAISYGSASVESVGGNPKGTEMVILLGQSTPSRAAGKVFELSVDNNCDA